MSVEDNIVGAEAGLRELHFAERTPSLDPADRDPSALRDVCEQLEQYFAGERDAFDSSIERRYVLHENRCADDGG